MYLFWCRSKWGNNKPPSFHISSDNHSTSGNVCQQSEGAPGCNGLDSALCCYCHSIHASMPVDVSYSCHVEQWSTLRFTLMRWPSAPLRLLKYEAKLKKSVSLRYKHAFFCETSASGWTASLALCPSSLLLRFWNQVQTDAGLCDAEVHYVALHISKQWINTYYHTFRKMLSDSWLLGKQVCWGKRTMPGNVSGEDTSGCSS